MARLALHNLSLVDKAFSRCAPRQLFRGIHVLLNCGLSSISKIEALSSSDYARHVRLIQFEYRHAEPWVFARNTENEEDIDDEEEVIEGQFAKLSKEAVDRLSLVMAKFRNLNAVDIWSDQDELPKTTMGFVPQIITTIADLQLRGFFHRLTYLRVPVEGADYLKMLVENNNHNAAIQNFPRRIKDMELISFVVMDDIDEWLDLIQSSPNSLYLTMHSNCTLVPLTTINSVPGFRIESLHFSALEITSYHLLALLEECKCSITFISLDHITLLSGTWIHILFQIKKCKNLIDFSLEHCVPFLDGFWFEYAKTDKLLPHALGDVQRQVNANRLAAGVDRLC